MCWVVGEWWNSGDRLAELPGESEACAEDCGGVYPGSRCGVPGLIAAPITVGITRSLQRSEPGMLYM